MFDTGDMLKGAALTKGGFTSLQRDLVTPLYHQVYLVLREKLRTGEFGDKGKLPTESALCRMFGVSRITIRRALADLGQDKLVVRRQGTGTFAKEPIPITPMTRTIDEYVDHAKHLAKISSTEVVQLRYVKPPPHVVASMGCDPHERMQHSLRVRSIEGRPFLMLNAYTLASLGLRFTRENLERESFLSLLGRAATIDFAEQTISATVADPQAAALLGVSVGGPLIKVNLVFETRNGRKIAHVDELARPDMYQIKRTLPLEGGKSRRR